ncbi:hypothetical protein RISK_004462 [Rhodopirellula islandica]|uniref:Uncharacterized protein n=1 Tax=Rhodopirellula islandica TaxID=595434 RepID=A0A0J1BA21_RHOIS|nr:hypothetical protein RISK_004462 [Rhodopirellula islandica]
MALVSLGRSPDDTRPPAGGMGFLFAFETLCFCRESACFYE